MKQITGLEESGKQKEMGREPEKFKNSPLDGVNKGRARWIDGNRKFGCW